jgi:hypothetical protein
MVEKAPGYPVIVKINLPPEKQYHSGHSMIVQGTSPEAVAGELQALVPDAQEGVGWSILRRFAEYALLGVVKAELGATEAAPVGDDTSRSSATESSAPDSDPPASANLLKAAAKKSGKTVEELGSITTSEAKRLIKEGK